MASCPECQGEMRRDRKSGLMVCTICGLALTRSELDREQRKKNDEYHDKIEDKDASQKREYLKWWLKDNKEDS
ncbi:MAG: hypothetical protein ACW976_00775 [Candidatus Ranarchaeia archaeon]|jgi:transcription initiation factor TFIIIB Brf1 subunit/transcription initiation factor TFIIB